MTDTSLNTVIASTTAGIRTYPPTLQNLNSFPFDVRLTGVVLNGTIDNKNNLPLAIASASVVGATCIKVPGPCYLSDVTGVTFNPETTLDLTCGALLYPFGTLISVSILSLGVVSAAPTISSSNGATCTAVVGGINSSFGSGGVGSVISSNTLWPHGTISTGTIAGATGPQLMQISVTANAGGAATAVSSTGMTGNMTIVPPNPVTFTGPGGASLMTNVLGYELHRVDVGTGGTFSTVAPTLTISGGASSASQVQPIIMPIGQRLNLDGVTIIAPPDQPVVGADGLKNYYGGISGTPVNREVPVEWFGADPLHGTLSRIPFLNALISGIPIVTCKAATYNLEDAIVNPGKCTLVGAGPDATTLFFKAGSNFTTIASGSSFARGMLTVNGDGYGVVGMTLDCEQPTIASLGSLNVYAPLLGIDNCQEGRVQDVYLYRGNNGLFQYTEGAFFYGDNIRVSCFGTAFSFAQAAGKMELHNPNVGTHGLIGDQVTIAAANQIGLVQGRSLLQVVGGIFLCPQQIIMNAGLPVTIAGAPPGPYLSIVGMQFDSATTTIQVFDGRLQLEDCQINFAGASAQSLLYQTGGRVVIGGSCRASVFTNGPGGTGGPLFQVAAAGSAASGCALMVNGLQVSSYDFDTSRTFHPLLLTADGPAEIMFRAQLVVNANVSYSGRDIIHLNHSNDMVYADVDVSITAPAGGVAGGNAINVEHDMPGRISLTCPGRATVLPAGATHLKSFIST